MISIPTFALLLAVPQTPQPLTELHMRDIGCVAVMGLIAYDQGRKAPGSQEFPDVRESGKRWAGIVGDRVMRETGQPRELVAFAVKEAVNAEQKHAIGAKDPKAYAKDRYAACAAAMNTDLAVPTPLPKPQKRK